MKTILQILACLFVIHGYAQDPRLFENTWYLTEMTVNGTHHLPPADSEIPFVPAQFDEPSGFATGACEATGIGNIIYNGTTGFAFENLAFLAGGCSSSFNNYFINEYLSVWEMQQNNFTYTIVENPPGRTLTVINGVGDVAVFGSQLLATTQNEAKVVSIFPNPTDGVLYISHKANFSSASVHDTNGRLLQNFDLHSGTIDITHLPSGIYLLSLKAENRPVTTEKIVKM